MLPSTVALNAMNSEVVINLSELFQKEYQVQIQNCFWLANVVNEPDRQRDIFMFQMLRIGFRAVNKVIFLLHTYIFRDLSQWRSQAQFEKYYVCVCEIQLLI